jgi:hypothetical protein
MSTSAVGRSEHVFGQLVLGAYTGHEFIERWRLDGRWRSTRTHLQEVLASDYSTVTLATTIENVGIDLRMLLKNK